MKARIIITNNNNRVLRHEEIEGKNCQELEYVMTERHYALEADAFIERIEYIEPPQVNFEYKLLGDRRYHVQWGIETPFECSMIVLGDIADFMNFLARKGYK